MTTLPGIFIAGFLWMFHQCPWPHYTVPQRGPSPHSFTSDQQRGRNHCPGGTRATLTSGTVILTPLLLGELADAVGIRPAYGIVLVLLISIFAITQVARKISVSSNKAGTL